MANAGVMPTYKYHPHEGGERPRVKTHSAVRARLFNDTYFRATEPGQPGNRISIALVQVGSPMSGTKTGTLYVTNHNTKEVENAQVNGLSELYFEFLDCSALDWNETITFTIISPNELRALQGISLQIAPFAPLTLQNKDLGLVRPGALFYGPKGISMKLDMEHTQLIPGDTFILKPRVQEYPLTWTTVSITGDDGTTTSYDGWDIDKLRDDITANPKSWVQMMPRSGAVDPDPPPSPPFDYQDDGVDAPVLEAFEDVYLAGGDGLPATPDEQKTGPSRSIIHLNYSETDNGMMGVVNKIYEWSGTTHINGEWLDLFS